MRPHKRLGTLEYSARKRLGRLHYLVSDSLPTLSYRVGEACLSYVVIETQNTWSNFSRAYFLSSVLHPTTVSGVKVTISRGPLSFDGAIGLAISKWGKRGARPRLDGSWHRRDEPAWHDYTILLRACQEIGSSNLAHVRAGLSSGSRVFTDLGPFRNFFAHRNLATEHAAMQLAPQYGIPATLRPSQILLTPPLGRPQPLILDWIDDLSSTIEYLCH